MILQTKHQVVTISMVGTLVQVCHVTPTTLLGLWRSRSLIHDSRIVNGSRRLLHHQVEVGLLVVLEAVDVLSEGRHD